VRYFKVGQKSDRVFGRHNSVGFCIGFGFAIQFRNGLTQNIRYDMGLALHDGLGAVAPASTVLTVAYSQPTFGVICGSNLSLSSLPLSVLNRVSNNSASLFVACFENKPTNAAIAVMP